MNWELQSGLDAYGDWLMSDWDMRTSYREYKQYLQVLLDRNPAEQLVLKCPEHLWFVDADTVVLPGALARLGSVAGDIVTAVPHQRVETVGERLVVPLQLRQHAAEPQAGFDELRVRRQRLSQQRLRAPVMGLRRGHTHDEQAVR